LPDLLLLMAGVCGAGVGALVALAERERHRERAARREWLWPDDEQDE